MAAKARAQIGAKRTGVAAALTTVVALTTCVVLSARVTGLEASVPAARPHGDRARAKRIPPKQRATSSSKEQVVRSACGSNCRFAHASGGSDATPPPGIVATPVYTTYSVHHMVGADIGGNLRCFFIFDPSDPPPGAPDDVVTYDAIAETIRTDTFGTVPTVIESKTDNADGTHHLVIDTSSPSGTDLFPEGVVDEASGTPLTDACFVIGFDDLLDWPGMDTVTTASISLLRDGQIVTGPTDVTSLFLDPWTGFFGATFPGNAGLGINGVHLDIVVAKTRQGDLAACCAGGECIGDIEKPSCDFQNGNWHPAASCGADPTLPPPVCDQALCGFSNGLPLDDGGAAPSQFAPDSPFAVAAADDFILKAPSAGACEIRLVRAWMTHDVGGIDPQTDYQGVNVTVYADAVVKGPNGRPEDDGSHTPLGTGGILFTQTLPMTAVTVAPWLTSCVSEVWQLDMPVNIALNKNTRYWLEVQPVMNAARGHASWMLSENNNDNFARQIGEQLGMSDWQEILGNGDSCPDGIPPTPDAGTRLNLAFELLGEDISAPVNDNCVDAIPVDDGIVVINTLGATTDGADEPTVCDFFGYTNVESDIWFEYTASCSGDLTVSMCGSAYDAKLAVYDACGRCPPQNEAVACDDDACGMSGPPEVTLPVSQGRCYRIRVGGFFGTTGKGMMSIGCEIPPPPTGACCDRGAGTCRENVLEADCSGTLEEWTAGVSCGAVDPPCAPPPPPNDLCADAVEVFTNEPYSGTTTNSTGSDITGCTFNDALDVWHRWTADCTGSGVFTLCDSSYDTTLAIFDACGGNELACNDDECGLQSEISPGNPLFVPVTAGETYYVRVSGYNNNTGDYTLEVKSCANACCFISPTSGDQICAMGSPEQCASVDGVLYEPGSVCLGDANRNGLDDLCERPPSIWLWKDYNGNQPGGLMPDYDQNKDYDNADGDADPGTGVDQYYCGPTAAADSIWWLHHRFPDAGIVPPQYTKLDLVEHLARRMGTNGTPGHVSPNGHPGPYAGTFIDDFKSGLRAYLGDNRLTNLFTVRSEPAPPFDAVADELAQDGDVVLLLGFYHVDSVDHIGDPPNDAFVVHWRRTGGHYVTVAGLNAGTAEVAVSDPDADTAEEGAAGFVRGGDHDHDGDGDPGTTLPFRDRDRDHIKHNDKGLASHDIYNAAPSLARDGSWMLTVEGDPLAYGTLMAPFHDGDAGGSFTPQPPFVERTFLEQNGYPLPAASQMYTVVEHAVIVSPGGEQACCIPDGSCAVTAAPDCRRQGGVPLGPGSVCLDDGDQNGTDDACDLNTPCQDCGTSDHWVDQCAAGTDNLYTGAVVGIDLNLDCRADTNLVLAGPAGIWRSAPLDDSLNFPGTSVSGAHLDVIDTEIVAMSLTGGGVTLTAGAGSGRGGMLRPSLGTIVEQGGEPALADSFFDVFFEIDLGGGDLRYNQTPLRVESKIDCMPPNATYVHVGDCLPLFDSPVAGEGTHTANLVTASHDTFVECGSAAAGDCFTANGTPYCNNLACCEQVCAQRSLCCNTGWDLICAGMAEAGCERCPAATIARAEPPDGTVDARQPHAPGDPQARQGIGSQSEPIVIALDPPVAGAEQCFNPCETEPDASLGSNSILSVSYLGNGRYEIVLDHPITAGAVTTIEYKGDGSFVAYTSHPANVDGDATAGATDVAGLIDCCVNGNCQPAWGSYSCDIDRSGRTGPADILREIDLLNGGDAFDPWLDTQRPVNLVCPSR